MNRLRLSVIAPGLTAAAVGLGLTLGVSACSPGTPAASSSVPATSPAAVSAASATGTAQPPQATTPAATTTPVANVTASATTSPVPSAPAAVLITCQEALAKAPGTFQYACADDGIGLQDMHWTLWGIGRATGYGTEWDNLCQPNCADGKIAHYPVTVVLSGAAQVSGQSAVRYTTLTVTFTTQARPPYYPGRGKVTYPSTQTLPLWGLVK